MSPGALGAFRGRSTGAVGSGGPGNQQAPSGDHGGVRERPPAAWPWLALAARLAVGGVFVVAGALKLPDPAAAVRAVRAYQLLPEPFVAPVAFGLPALEIALGLALLAGIFVRTAAIASALLLNVFIAGVASAWSRGLQIDCGCFGDGGPVAAGETAYPAEILRDVALLVAACFLALRPASRLALGTSSMAVPSRTPEASRAE